MSQTRAKIRNRFSSLFKLFLTLLLLPALSSEQNYITYKCFSSANHGCVFEQGQAGAVLIKSGEPLKSLNSSLWDKPVSFKPLDQTRKLWLAYIAPDRKLSPGKYQLRLSLQSESAMAQSLEIPVLVQAKSYPVEELTLPIEMAEFPPEIVERINQDNKNLLAGMSALNPVCYWEGAFEKPVPGEVSGVFGAQRIINKVPRSPHTGTDFKADTGQEVRAINNGKVSLVYVGYLTGNSLIIDHGCGLYSVYYHLSEILVKQGEDVKKAQVIARAGMSGRASGPHLHLSIRLNNSYLDPLSLFLVSEMAEKEIAGKTSQ